MTPACNNYLVMTLVDFKKYLIYYICTFFYQVYGRNGSLSTTHLKPCCLQMVICVQERNQGRQRYIPAIPPCKQSLKEIKKKEIKEALFAGGYSLSMLNR